MTYGLADVVQQRRLIESSEADDAYKRVSTAKLDALLGLCETAGCRRVRLLAYFGEACAALRQLRHLPRAAADLGRDGRRAARRCPRIYRTGQRFGALHVIDVLRGHASERVTKWNHEQLAVFGLGADLDEAAWRSVFRQLVALGFVEVDHGAYGALKLAPASRPVLKGEQRVEMRRVAAPGARPRRERSRVSETLADGDLALLDKLKAWRLDEARTQAVPAYVILHDSTLAELARRRPRSVADLADVAGIGARKLERYGQALLGVLAT